MSKPIVFISYSHNDEKEKEQLAAHLKVLENAGLVELWVDDRIEGGADWQKEIKQAISQASVAILLVSKNLLTSDFTLSKEIPEFLRRRQDDGLIIFPIIAKACHWEVSNWLAEMNVRPKNGTPVWSGNEDEIDQRLTTITKEIKSIVEKKAKRNPVVTPSDSLLHTSKKKLLMVVGVVIAGIIIVGLFIPPYNVSDVNWCVDSNQSVEVIGRLTTKFLKMPVPDGFVQIKVFEIGSPFPHSEDTKYVTTSADGWFAVTFPPPIPSADKTYIINVAYSYDYLLLGERWKISNFGVGALLACPTQ